AYLIGVAPALLVLWVRTSVEEPQTWTKAEHQHKQMGSFRDLFGTPRWARSAILGMLLATVGLGMFWAVTIAGQDLTKDMLLRHDVPPDEAEHKATFAYGWVQSIGGFLGLLSFGPLAQRLGRRGAFALMHVCAVIVVPITCYLPQTYGQMLAILPVFGFFTLGIHAGYAVYFPELFPNHLRATGTGVCFNGGRLSAAAFMLLSAWVKSLPGVDLRMAVSLLSLFFLMGLVVIAFMPETRGKPLPE
ncbi:MAG TPA: MFS transporter, partial [Pirellulales bacterium]|nr:MFS transporter [Pirellulales bacterium]